MSRKLQETEREKKIQKIASINKDDGKNGETMTQDESSKQKQNVIHTGADAAVRMKAKITTECTTLTESKLERRAKQIRRKLRIWCDMNRAPNYFNRDWFERMYIVFACWAICLPAHTPIRFYASLDRVHTNKHAHRVRSVSLNIYTVITSTTRQCCWYEARTVYRIAFNCPVSVICLRAECISYRWNSLDVNAAHVCVWVWHAVHSQLVSYFDASQLTRTDVYMNMRWKETTIWIHTMDSESPNAICEHFGRTKKKASANPKLSQFQRHVSQVSNDFFLSEDKTWSERKFLSQFIRPDWFYCYLNMTRTCERMNPSNCFLPFCCDTISAIP